MQEIPQLLLHNRAWAAEQLEEDPDFFKRRLDGQKPAFLWIGCSDSRVQPDHFTQAAPGGLFVHRNIANLVRHDDANLMAVLDFAVMTLGVNDIVICGHYACGGIAASLGKLPDSPVGHWLEHVVDVLDAHRAAVECIHDPDERVNRLVEINVRDQLLHLAQTTTVQAAFASGRPLKLHGWVYDLRDGLIKPLLDIDSSTMLDEVGAPDRVLV